MNNKILLSSCFALAATAFAGTANAQHDVRAFLSEGGLDFIAQEAPSYLPSVLEPPTFAKSIACMDFEQRDTTINLSIDNLEIAMPSDGRIRIELDFSGSADGTLYADDIYACFGEITCQDSLDIRTAHAVFDYELMVVDGEARVVSRDNQFSLDPDDFSFELTGCGFTGDALTGAIDFTESWILGYLETKVAGLAEEHLGPMMESMLAGFQFQGSAAIAEYSAALSDLSLTQGGLAMQIDANLTDRYAPAECVQQFDVGGPGDLEGPVPAIEGPGASHANLAVNMGLMNKGLYTIWRRGLLCLTDEHVAGLGVELDLSTIGVMLPGFPPGTKFSFEINLSDYPRVRPNESSDTEMTIEINGLMVDLHGDRPDGTRNTLHVELDADATAGILIDPATNAIVAQLKGAEIRRMVMEDERKATGDGFDVARIIQLVEDHILPTMLDHVGPMPLTGPAFAFGDYAVILRKMTTNAAYMSAGLDLFKAPEVDTNAPDTQIVEYPQGPTNPHDAVLRVKGSDAEIPSELLQYEISIDGETQPISFIREFHVGEVGRSNSYQVRVAAVDLKGNIDPTPAEMTVMVDGIVPVIGVSGPRTRRADEGPITINWTLSDDITASENLEVRAEIYELEDPSDALSARLIDTQVLAKGATSTTVELENIGGVYRVEIHAVDEAGNDSKTSLLLTTPSAGGCSVGGKGASGNALFLLLALGLLAFRRRK